MSFKDFRLFYRNIVLYWSTTVSSIAKKPFLFYHIIFGTSYINIINLYFLRVLQENINSVSQLHDKSGNMKYRTQLKNDYVLNEILHFKLVKLIDTIPRMESIIFGTLILIFCKEKTGHFFVGLFIYRCNH